MTNIKKKKKKKIFLEFHEFRFKSAIPRIPRLFRDRGKSLALVLNHSRIHKLRDNCLPLGWNEKLRSHEHCEVNYLGRLEIIHFENTVGTRSSRRRISGVDSRGSTPGGGFGDTPYLNSLRIVVGTQSVLANPLHIVQPCAVGYPR